VIGSRKLEEVLGGRVIETIYRNTILIALEKDPVLKNLTKRQTERLISVTKIASFAPGETVIPRTHKRGSYIWIVLNGRLV
jgi:hypothetical protein